MTEPKFIRNNEPHQVSMPEGSRVAVSKSADVGGPSVRKTVAEAEDLILEAVDPLLNLAYDTPDVVRNLTDFELKEKYSDSEVTEPSERVFQEINVEKSPVFTTEYIETEMNFPARLIHLKIENDKVKGELDELDKMMASGI